MTAKARSAVFDGVAAGYESWFDSPLGSFVDEMELQALRRLLDGCVLGSVLEIGAGTGHLARHLCEWGGRVTAVEPSAAMRSMGQRCSRDLPIGWVNGRAEALPCAEAGFDGAVLFTTLEFVDDPATALSEALRVVRTGGCVAAGFLNALSPWVAAYRHRGDRGRLPWAAARYFVRDDLEKLVGRPADRAESAVHLAPGAQPPFEEAELAGVRAGNAPAMTLLLWSKPP